MTTTANVTRPTPAFRVGITGARSIRADQAPRIRAQLGEVLTLIQDEVQRLTALPRSRAIYHDDGFPPILRLLSPLARGADRMAAEVALELDPTLRPFNLCVPMPFSQEDYESGFTGTTDKDVGEAPITAQEDLRQFHHWLSQATDTIEMDGKPQFPRTSSLDPSESFEAVGRFVARHSDILIGVWDGTHGNGLPWSPPHPPFDKIGRFWFDRYVFADAIASVYSARYRSSYLWTIALTTITLISASAAMSAFVPAALLGQYPT